MKKLFAVLLALAMLLSCVAALAEDVVGAPADLVEAAKAEGDVVLDWGFHHRADREDTLRYFRERGKEVRLLWIDIPENELQRRRDWRNAHLPPDCYYIDENLARKCDSRFEPPAPDEDYIKIDYQEK